MLKIQAETTMVDAMNGTSAKTGALSARARSMDVWLLIVRANSTRTPAHPPHADRKQDDQQPYPVGTYQPRPVLDLSSTASTRLPFVLMPVYAVVQGRPVQPKAA